MALRDLFRRRTAGAPGRPAAAGAGAAPGEGAGTGGVAGGPTAAADPGSVSSPQDVEGQGTVGLQDRTAPGGQASPDTNQGKTEPIPASPGQADPTAPIAPPELGDMNVGSADPQAPSHPAARDRDDPFTGGQLPAGPINDGSSPAAGHGLVDPDSTTGLGDGPGMRASATDGRAQRQPGSLGSSPEEQHTDVQAGAAAMAPGGSFLTAASPDQAGDSQGVAVPHEDPAPGTSEEQGIVRGARMPADDGDHPE